MGRRQIAVVCESCDTQLRSDSPFCPGCGKPTLWATHDERVAWEVRQWRASRDRETASSGTLILVRTEGGYEPVRVAAEQFIWDQPLHPEREQEPPQQQSLQRRATDAHPATEVPPAPAGRESSEEHTTIDADVSPVPPAPPPKPVAPMPFAMHAPAAAEPAIDVESERDVRISKKAVAVAIVLAVGLPLGSKVLRPSGAADRSPSAAPAKAAAGAIRPLALTSARSGFTQVSPDAVRFAVVVRNPNRTLAARGTDVVVSFHDRAGRLIGSTIERITSVPAGGAVAVAGQTGVDGTVASVRSRVSVAGFDDPSSANPFVVRGTSVSRTKSTLVVRMAVAAKRAVRGARVVVVHVDRRGRILGGDFAFVDVPALPRAVRTTVSTSGLGGAVHHVEVYVLDPR